MPPLTHHLTTMGLKVARQWVGVLRPASPRCLNTYSYVTVCGGGAPGFLCRFLIAFFNSRTIAGLKSLVFYFSENVENMGFSIVAIATSFRRCLYAFCDDCRLCGFGFMPCFHFTLCQTLLSRTFTVKF